MSVFLLYYLQFVYAKIMQQLWTDF